MKTIYLFIFFICSICSGQIINLPDLNFKTVLLQASGTSGIACIGSSSNTCVAGPIDTNGNGEIDVTHLSAGIYYLKNNKTGVLQKVIIAK